MQKQEFLEKYRKQLNLDNKVWDLPSKAVVGFKSQIHPFHVQVSLKQEIDVDCLYYFIKNNLYELNVANNLHIFLDEKNRESLGIIKIEKGKLTALKIPSSYLTKIKIFDDTNDINFFNKVEFPIKDTIVKPIDDYLNDKPFGMLSFDEKEDVFNPFVIDYSESFKDENLQITFDELVEDNSLKKSNNEFNKLKRAKDGIYIPESIIKEPLSQFEEVITNRINYIQDLLITKSKEYVGEKSKFHNFDRAASLTGDCREKILWGYLLKHIVSIQDIINDINTTGTLPSKEKLSEKISDFTLYGLILEASIENKRDK